MTCVQQTYSAHAPQGGWGDGSSGTFSIGRDGSLKLIFDEGDIGEQRQDRQKGASDVPEPESCIERYLKIAEDFLKSFGKSGGGNSEGAADGANGCEHEAGDEIVKDKETPAHERIAQKAAYSLLNSTAFNREFPDGNLSHERLVQIAENKDGKFDKKAVKAAQSLLDNKLSLDFLDNADRHGELNGTTDMHDLRAAAGMTPTRQAVMSLMEDAYVKEHYGSKMTRENLTELAADPKAGHQAREAAQYFLDNPLAFSDLDTAYKGGNGDERFNIKDMTAYIIQGDAGITEDEHGAGRQRKGSSFS